MEPYPLQWPVGYRRTKDPQRNPRFRRGTTFAMERDELLRELKRFEVKEVVISSSVPLRQDGLPRSDFSRLTIPEKGVAVYFKLDGRAQVLCCDAWDSWEHNIRAITKTIEAIRGLGNWGASEIIERAFSGLKVLPERAESLSRWWEILGVAKNDPWPMVKIERNRLAWLHHPDRGGDSERLARINEAYQLGARERGEQP